MRASPRYRGPPSPKSVKSRLTVRLAGKKRAVEPYASFRVSARLSVDSVAYRFSHAHPELRIEILGRMDLDPDHQVVEVRALGPDASQYADELRAFSRVSQVDVHSETDRDAHYRISLDTDSAARAVRRFGILTRYPIVLQDGWLRLETVAPAGKIRRLIRHLERSVGPARIEAVRRRPVRAGELGLTAAQDHVFREALHAGYFNAPRGISVTELARKIGRSKSTVSQQLAKIQRHLAESALQLELGAFPP